MRGESERSVRAKRLFRTALALFTLPLAALLALGTAAALIPPRHLAIAYAGVFVTAFTTHLLLAVALTLALGLLIYALGGRRAGRATFLLALLAGLFCCVPLVAFWRAALAQEATLSARDNLRLEFNTGSPGDARDVAYAVVEGQELKLDIWLPPVPRPAPAPAIIWVHGGGWEQGSRGMTPHWNTWLNARGYAVFDIDYRLSPPPRWDQALVDVRCAVRWVKLHAAEYGVDPQRLMLVGGSAGGNLALMAAYTGDDAPAAGCASGDPSVVAVAAIHPVTDAVAWWRSGLPAGSYFTERYIGGTPDEFPARYEAISPVRHVRPGLPPTLLTHGTADRTVPYDQSLALAAALASADVPHTLVTLPYTAHGYDRYWGSFSAQLTRHAFAAFLDRYLPLSSALPRGARRCGILGHHRHY